MTLGIVSCEAERNFFNLSVMKKTLIDLVTGNTSFCWCHRLLLRGGGSREEMSSLFPSLAGLALYCAPLTSLSPRLSQAGADGVEGCCGHKPASQTPFNAFAECRIRAFEGTRPTEKTKKSPEFGPIFSN